jgi:uncharacterized protein (TIGR02118 family)
MPCCPRRARFNEPFTGTLLAATRFGATMIKSITLLKRKPGISVQAFQDHWLNVHGPLVAKAPGLNRYVQSHALIQGYGKGDLLFDGIEERWFDSPQVMQAFCTSPDAEAAIRDAATFLDGSRTIVMRVDVFVIKDGAIPKNAVKNIEFVNRRPGMTLPAFQRYWREIHGPIASRISVIRRYEQNHLTLSEYAEDAVPAYDGLAVTWFDSTDEMRRGASTPEYTATRLDEAKFLPPGHLPIIITREHVFPPSTPA